MAGPLPVRSPRTASPRPEGDTVMRLLTGARVEPMLRPSAPRLSSIAERIHALAQRAGLPFTIAGPAELTGEFTLEGDRLQQVIIRDSGDLGGKAVIHIMSPVADLKQYAVGAPILTEVLSASSRTKIGSFHITPQSYLIFGQSAFLDTLTPELLAATVTAVAMIADEAERELTGGDAF